MGDGITTMSAHVNLAVPAEVLDAISDPEHKWIAVCMGTGCTSSASAEVRQALREELDKHNLNGQVEVRRTGCFGFCEQGPIVVVYPAETFYTRVKPSDVKAIIEEHVLGGCLVERLLYRDPATNSIADSWHKIGFYAKQKRIVLHNCGIIDPENIDHFLARDGYRGLHKAVTEMTPEQVIKVISKSGLRGRGGAGFPTGRKWATARQAPGTAKYVICNADEGDPGAFMNRSLLEGDPHCMLEGLTIAGYAVGAKRGFVYVRAEYPLAVERIQKAIQASRNRGLLGTNIFGRGFDFDIEIRLGAGAFVCGEETALMQSIEGRRGMPRTRPPYPAEKGLWDLPTTINNVETLAWVPLIIRHGWEWYAGIGTETSKGSKTFALTGKVNNTGLVEVPMGTTLRELIFDIGGGILDNRQFKAVQIGGPSGGCLPTECLDTPIDYESLQAAGSMMGSGGMVVMDERNCAVDIAHYFLSFTQAESCGKCAPCRAGTKRMLEILERIKAGEGKPEDVDHLEKLAHTVKNGSLCGLGQTAPNPVLTTLRYFRDEYLAHITEHRCPAATCQALITYEITDDCNGCTLCARMCPTNAIIGERKQKHTIDTKTCIRCGACYDSCNYNAIIVH
jgi:NADH:ubiquinone oxidoreductase subunit F (NADH-binding)/(2Fe-2S) ferredoxin/Pyruvate/2-oxoacid:ferredoxin oxidoreductase delta subunit